MSQTAANGGEQTDNPIDPWVFEICTKHGGAVTASDRFDQMEELVDRLAESTGIPIEESFDVAKEARQSHRLMADAAEMRGCLSGSESQALIDAFDRLVTAWVASPTEIDAELSEYREELEHIRTAQEGAR